MPVKKKVKLNFSIEPGNQCSTYIKRTTPYTL